MLVKRRPWFTAATSLVLAVAAAMLGAAWVEDVEAGPGSLEGVKQVVRDFLEQVVQQQIGAENLFRITITSFLDAYNFDVRRLMKCCIHHVLPSGHVIPFCAYNVLYREGHAALPALRDAGVVGDRPDLVPLGPTGATHDRS